METTILRYRKVIVALLATISLVAMSGCGGSSNESNDTASASSSPSTSQSSTPSKSPSSSPSQSSPSQTPSEEQQSTTCATGQLSASLNAGSGGGAGSVYPNLVLTNNGESCVTQGYPGVSLTVSGKRIGAEAKRTDSVAAQPITLATGQSAYASVRIVQAGNFDQATCQPTKADALLVYPPDQKDALTITTEAYTGCANADTPILEVTALQAGTGQ